MPRKKAPTQPEVSAEQPLTTVVVAPTPLPAPSPTPAAEVAPVRRQVQQRQNRGFEVNWTLVIILVAFATAYVFFTNFTITPTAAPATSSDSGDTVVVTETPSISVDVVCANVLGLREDRQFWLTVSQDLQKDPSVTSDAVRGTHVLSSDILTTTGEYACDENQNYWLQVVVVISGNTIRSGWVQIADSQNSWFVWADTQSAPVPAATEEASAPQGNSQLMRSIQVGTGACAPRLQPADFYNADALNAQGEDKNPNWSGFWVRSTIHRQDNDVIVRASATRQSEDIARFGWNDEGEPESVEVIAYRDGFHFQCGDSLIWWNVRWYGVNQDGVRTTIEGWVAETDGTSSNFMIEGFDL